MNGRCRALFLGLEAASAALVAVLCVLLSGDVILAKSSGEIVRRGPVIQFFGPVLQQYSQYSPFLFTQPGWDSDLLFYCKNVYVAAQNQSCQRDRVYRIEHHHTNPLTDWQNDDIAAQGNDTHADDDLSCSPGVVIDRTGTWHLYYIGASRFNDLTLYLLHAVADAPGAQWRKVGPVKGIPQPLPFYFETPTPFLNEENGVSVITIFLDGEGLRKLVSIDDGYTFTMQSQKIPTPWTNVQAGRVSMAMPSGAAATPLHILCFSGGYLEKLPTSLTFVRSTDGGRSFNASITTLLESSEADAAPWFKNGAVWSPHCRIKNYTATSVTMLVVFAGAQASAAPFWWGGASSIGGFEVEVKFEPDFLQKE
jgi:hypothetical protein